MNEDRDPDSVDWIELAELAGRWKQPISVENRAGAGSIIGAEMVAKAPPDGYTLLCVSPGHAVAPSLIKGVTWDPVRDFRAIEGFGIIPNVIVVHPSVPAKTMAEFVALAKASASPVTYATAGVGTSNHLSAELLAQSAGIKLTHVPYKGQPDAMNDLLGGRVSMMPLTAALAGPLLKAGKLRALAVTTATRSAALPGVPTVAESANLPGYEVGTWFGLVTQAKVPDAIARKLLSRTPLTPIDRLTYALGWALLYRPLRHHFGLSRVKLAGSGAARGAPRGGEPTLLVQCRHCGCPAIMAPIASRCAGSAGQAPMIRPR